MVIATAVCRFGTEAIARGAELIAAGQPVACATETVYGLAADATDGRAVARIYAAKGRPAFNPLIVHVRDLGAAEKLGVFAPAARELALAHWPGPLTLVVPVRARSPVADLATAGLSTIALRVPSHRALRALLDATAVPLAAPSANASGRISPTSAQHVASSLDGRIALVIDDGPCPIGIESTIVAVTDGAARILRPGPIVLDLPLQTQGVRIAPGQMASHYAPSKALRLDATASRGDEFMIGYGQVCGDVTLSAAGDLIEAAATLFTALHQADASRCAAIACAAIPRVGIGLAINDRLGRAAAPVR